jgi:hypothetical protein
VKLMRIPGNPGKKPWRKYSGRYSHFWLQAGSCLVTIVSRIQGGTL